MLARLVWRIRQHSCPICLVSGGAVFLSTPHLDATTLASNVLQRDHRRSRLGWLRPRKQVLCGSRTIARSVLVLEGGPDFSDSVLYPDAVRDEWQATEELFWRYQGFRRPDNTERPALVGPGPVRQSATNATAMVIAERIADLIDNRARGN